MNALTWKHSEGDYATNFNVVDVLHNPSIRFSFKFLPESNAVIMKIYKNAINSWSLSLDSCFNKSVCIPILQGNRPCIVSKIPYSLLFLELLSRLPYESCTELVQSTIVTNQYLDKYYVFLRNDAGNIDVKIYETSGFVRCFPLNFSYKGLLRPFDCSYSSEETLKAIVHFQDWFKPEVDKDQVVFRLDMRIYKPEYELEMHDLVEKIELTLTPQTKISLALLEDYLNYLHFSKAISLACWNKDQSLATCLLDKIYVLIQKKACPMVVIFLLERYEDLLEKIFLAPYLSINQDLKDDSFKSEFLNKQECKIESIIAIIKNYCNMPRYSYLVDNRINRLIIFINNIKNSDSEFIALENKEILKKGPGYLETLIFLIRINYYLLNLPRAIYYCNHGIRESSNTYSEEKQEKCRLYMLKQFYLLLADMLFEIGDYKCSLSVCEKASADLAIKQISFDPLLSVCAANCYIEMQDFNKAESLLNKILKSCENNSEDLIGFCVTMGNLEVGKGNYKKAITQYENYIQKKKKNQLDFYIAVQANLASVYRKIFDFDKAIYLLNECLSELKNLPMLRRPFLSEKIYNELALVYLHRNQELDDINKAENNLKKVEKIADQYNLKETKARVCVNLAEVYIEKKDFEKAEHYCALAKNIGVDIGDKGLEGAAYSAYGKLCVDQDNLQQALDYFKLRKLIGEKTGNKYNIALSWHNMGGVALQLNKLYDAKEFLLQAVKIYSEIRASAGFLFSEGVTSLKALSRSCLCLEYVLHELNDSKQAFIYADFRKARALLEVLNPKCKSNNIINDILTIDEASALAKRLCSTIIIYSLSPLDINEAQCWVISPQGSVNESRKLKLDAIWEELEVKSNRIGYLRGPLFDRDVKIDNVKIGDKFEDRIEMTSKVRGNESFLLPKEKDLVKLWYNNLIAPIEDLLPTEEGARVAIIPDSVIHQLPFAIFLDEDGKHLMEKYTLFSAPSVETLLRLEKLQEKKHENNTIEGLCVFADPSPEKKLSGALQEGKKAASLLKGKHFCQDAATLENFHKNIPYAKYIHIASHGIASQGDGNPMKKSRYSVFQGSLSLRDGDIYGDDIVSLSLNADFAILSACESGKGNLCEEGIVGLSHAFLGAGVSSVIATRWGVPDDPTQFLMDHFYDFYNIDRNEDEQGLFSQAEALRRAMLATKEKYPANMKAWGAFFLQGLPITFKKRSYK